MECARTTTPFACTTQTSIHRNLFYPNSKLHNHLVQPPEDYRFGVQQRSQSLILSGDQDKIYAFKIEFKKKKKGNKTQSTTERERNEHKTKKLCTLN